MSQHQVFKKSFDDELGIYCYEINGVEYFSNVDLSEDEVRSSIEVLY